MNYLQKKKMAMMNSVASGGRLPSEYQEVEWIENIDKATGNNANAFIKTDYYPTLNTKMVIECMTFSNSANISVCSNTSNSAIFGILRNSATTIQCYFFGNNMYYYNWSDDNKHHIELSADEVSVDDNIVATSIQGTSSESRMLPIFAYSFLNANIFYASHLRLYSYKLYESGTLVRDYVCCYRKSDDKVGLYDLVNSEFVTSANNYEFTKGNDV